MKAIFVSFLLLAGVFVGCNSAKNITGEVNFVSHTTPGTIELSVGGYGKTRKQAIENAEHNAFYNLLFKGIPGSQNALPMVPDADNALKKHKKYFEQLLAGKDYKKFMMSSEMQSRFSPQNRGRKNIVHLVKIDVAALRRDLENHQVIRKFGY